MRSRAGIAVVTSVAMCVCMAGAEPIVLVPGFVATREASGLSRPTQITFGPDGRLYVATQSGTILAYDYGPDGISGAARIVATHVGRTLLGIGFDASGTLYASSNDLLRDSGFLVRLLDDDGDGVYETRHRFVTGLPNAGHHNDQIVIADWTLFVGMGARTDDGDEELTAPVPTASLLRVELDQVDFHSSNNRPDTEALGLRNAFGLAIDRLGRVWAGDNGRDSPLREDELHLVIRGAHYGFPDDRGPDRAIPPVLKLGFGTSADGMAFYPAEGPWGPAFAENLFLVRFDYERNDPNGVGMDVVRVTFAAFETDHPVAEATVFAKGFLGPLDAEVDPFGNLLVMEYGTRGPSRDDGQIVRIFRAGDCDGDGDTDLADFLVFQSCFTGPGQVLREPTCACADFDADGDAELADLVSFQAAFADSN